MRKLLSVVFALCLLISLSASAVADTGSLLNRTGFLLLDNAYAYAEATRMYSDPNGDLVLEVFLQNQSDNDIEVYSDYIEVNRCMIDTFFYAALETDKRAIVYIELNSEELDDYGIVQADEIIIPLNVSSYDAQNDSWAVVAKETAILYPTGKTESEVERIEPELPFSDLSDDTENFSIKVYDAKFIETGGYEVDLCLINRSEADLTLVIDNAKVNGVDVNPFLYAALPYGSQSFAEMVIYGAEYVDRLAFDLDVFFGLDAYAQETPAYTVNYDFYPAKG